MSTAVTTQSARSVADSQRSMQRLLVIGGTGFLGTELIAQAAREFEVHATRFSSPQGAKSATWHQHDLTDPAKLAHLFASVRPQVVINAAYVKSGPKLRTVTGTAPGEMARLSALHKARFVHVSTDVVFPETVPGTAHAEDTPTNPSNAYGEAKAESEGLVRQHAGLIARTSLIYSATSPNDQLDLIEAAANGEPVVFFTDEVRNPVHVADLAACLLELATMADPPALLHLAGPDAVDRFTFAKLLANAAGYSSSMLRGGPSPPTSDRPRHLALNSTLAADRLSTVLRPLRDHLRT